jgi:hypothetical protein
MCCAKALRPRRVRAIRGPRLLIDKILYHRDIVGVFQCCDVTAEIAVGRLQDRFGSGALNSLSP